MTYTASLVKLNIDERIAALRADALQRGIPVADDETLQYLLVMLKACQPKRILEIGTAVGLSASAMLFACPNAKITTIELEEERYQEAKKNFKTVNLYENIRICGFFNCKNLYLKKN